MGGIGGVWRDADEHLLRSGLTLVCSEVAIHKIMLTRSHTTRRRHMPMESIALTFSQAICQPKIFVPSSLE